MIFGLRFLKGTQPQMVLGWKTKAWSLQSTRDSPELLPGRGDGKGQEAVRDAVGSSGTCDAGGCKQRERDRQTDCKSRWVSLPASLPSC